MRIVRTKDKELMFRTECDLHLTTTNSTLYKDNEEWKLIMGGGHALQVAQAMPSLPVKFANYLINNNYDYTLARTIRAYNPYGIIANPKIKFGAFQTKDWVNEDSKLSLIKFAVEKLNEYIKNYPDQKIIMPFPGIGLGNLPESKVYGLIEKLPDNVLVFKLEI